MKSYRLWEGDAPGALGKRASDIPLLTDFGSGAGPGKKAQAACVVCPGGAYAGLAPYEGQPPAEWFESIGVRGFVLTYRLGPSYHHPVMLEDAQRAIRYVRANAVQLGVDPNRVGICGFSAGGHLASMVSTQNALGDLTSSDPIDRQSSLPNFSVLLYPVIDMSSEYGHSYSREMLLGKAPTLQQIEAASTYRSVSLTTPAAFICHGSDDQVVPIQNSLLYAKALADHRVPFEMLVPQVGPHGFGLGKPGSDQDWRGLCLRWLRLRGITSFEL